MLEQVAKFNTLTDDPNLNCPKMLAPLPMRPKLLKELVDPK
jgi:hypothetical protein